MASSSEASCISDPNFAVICAFLERFAKSCGITYPTFVDLQEMLENVEQVPEELIELHVKLLRKARKTVFLEKWERALIKFCHTYSSQDGWEIERFGYQKSRLEVKLRVLKMLLEGQFDLNNKFKASINTLESEELRTKPLGRDKLGRIYWLQFDPSSNIRVYREDLDEESWTLVAKDRVSLVELLQELSGDEFPLDLNLLNEDSTSLEVDKLNLDTGQNINPSFRNDKNGVKLSDEASVTDKNSSQSEVKVENKETSSKLESKNEPDSFKSLSNYKEVTAINKINCQDNENEQSKKKLKMDEVGVKTLNEEDDIIVGETIEEPVIYVTGEGCGKDCETGNPDKDDKSQEECESLTSGNSLRDEHMEGSAQHSSEIDSSSTLSAEKVKPTPKLWSIDTICGVSFSKDTSSELNNAGKQESLDVKVKHKNFSSFSIDSVLEKKNVSQAFSESSSFTKISVNCSGELTSDDTYVKEGGNSLNEVNYSFVNAVDSDENYERTPQVENSKVLLSSLNSKTEYFGSEPHKEESSIKIMNSVSCENILNAKSQNFDENLSDNLKIEEINVNENAVSESRGVNVSMKEMSDVVVKKERSMVQMGSMVLEDRENKKESNEGKKQRDIKNYREDWNNLLEKKSGEIKKETETSKISSEGDSVETEQPSEIFCERLHMVKEKFEIGNKEKKDSKRESDSVAKESTQKLDKYKKISTEKKEPANDLVAVKEKEKMLDRQTESSGEKKEEEKPEESQSKIDSNIHSHDILKSQELRSRFEGDSEKSEEITTVESRNSTASRDDAEGEKAKNRDNKEVKIIVGNPKNAQHEENFDNAQFQSEIAEVSEIEKSNYTPGKCLEKSWENESGIVIEKPVVENMPNEGETTEMEISVNMLEEIEKNEEKKAEELGEEKEKVEKLEETEQKVGEIIKMEETGQPVKEPKKSTVLNEEIKRETEWGREEEKIEETVQEKELAEKSDGEKKNIGGLGEKFKKIGEGEDKKNASEDLDEKKQKIEKLDEEKQKSEKPEEIEESDKEKQKIEKLDEERGKTTELGKPAKETEKGMMETEIPVKQKKEIHQESKEKPEKSGHLKEKSNEDVVEDKSKKKLEETESSQDEMKKRKGKETVESSKTKDATAEEDTKNFKGNKSAKKRKKEVLPQRILSRNRKTIEEDESLDKLIAPKTRRKSKVSERDTIADKINEESGKRVTRRGVKEARGKPEEEEEQEEEEKGEKEKKKIEGIEEKQEPILEKEKCEECEKGKEEEKSEVVTSCKGKKPSRKHWNRRKRTLPEENKNSVEGKSGKKMKGEEEEVIEEEEDKNDSDGKYKKKGRPKKEEGGSRGRQIPAREIKLLGITEVDTELPSIRQSRRIAQIKLKEEAERRRLEALQLESFKSKKKMSRGKKKSKKNADSDSYEEKDCNEEDYSDEKEVKEDKKLKKKKKKDKLKFNELNPWLSSSGSSSADEEDEDIEDEPHEDEELVFKSDHEFSPESDVEDPDYKPMKRARTAKVEESKDEAGKYDDTACEKCGKNDHPEWILLCDKCDKGWHASCVRPALMVVPEGDWFCPPCEHTALLLKLRESLTQYDRCQKQRENEELRKKRLAFVGISLDNVLPSTKKKSSKHEDEDQDPDKEVEESNSESASESESSDSGSNSDDSEPVYQLRERRSNVTSYRYNEYDELIKSALQDEIEAVKGAGNAGRGKDINNIVNAERQMKAEENYKEEGRDVPKKESGGTEGEIKFKEGEDKSKEKVKKNGNDGDDDDADDDDDDDDDDDYEMETEGDDEEEDENAVDEIPPVVPKYHNKKKKSRSLKITSLDFTSEEEDHNSDSDFKGTSSEEESDYSLPSESESSGGLRTKKRGGEGPLRRSARTRVSRYDRDFINDDSEEDLPKRKKNQRIWDSSESSDSDRSWGRRKRRGNKASHKSPKTISRNKSKKKKKQKKRVLESDNEGNVTSKKPRNRKIKYGGLDVLDKETVLTRRTRGKKINYQEMNGSDSEEEVRNRKTRPLGELESDDDFLAENEKDEDGQDCDSEEMESGVDEDTEDEESSRVGGSNKENKQSVGKKKKLLEKIKKKKWVIPDPDDFSENDLREDEQLDEVAEELEDLDEEEEEILGNILESGDVPFHELKAAVKRAKDEKKLRKEEELKAKKMAEKSPPEIIPKSFPSVAAHMEFQGAGKFPKIGKVKITPSRAELASQLAGMSSHTVMPVSGKPVSFIQNVMGVKSAEKSLEGQNLSETKEKGINIGNAMSGFLLKTLQNDQKLGTLPDANIPPNHSIKDEPSVQAQRPFVPYPIETAQSGPLNMMAMMNSQAQCSSGSNNGGPGMIPVSVSNSSSMPPFSAFERITPPSRMPVYPATIPTTVSGISNIDPQAQSRKKPGPKPGTKTKRKMDEMSPKPDSCGDSSESGDVRLPLQQGDEFLQMKGVPGSPPKKKGRGRGKKQLLAEAQAQGKQDVNVTTVQAPTQFPPQGLPSEGGSVITRMLNTPQTFSSCDPNSFSSEHRNRPPFRPSIPAHFASASRPLSAMRLRPPAPASNMFHTSHPLDPSPSGGRAINIPVTSSGVTKPSPPPNFNRPSGPSAMPRFASDPRLPFPSQNSPPRPEFSTFPGYFGNFPPSGSSIPSNEDSNYQNPPFPEQFGEDAQVPGSSNPKPFDDETGGEFGGLASYFASQREDDLDT